MKQCEAGRNLKIVSYITWKYLLKRQLLEMKTQNIAIVQPVGLEVDMARSTIRDVRIL